jgi:hypothetical protein
MGIVCAVDKTAHCERLQHFRIPLALSGRRQDMAGHLGLDRGSALGFGKRRRGVLDDGLHH